MPLTVREVLNCVADALDVPWSKRPRHDQDFLDVIVDQLYGSRQGRLPLDLRDGERLYPVPEPPRPVATVATGGRL